MGQPMATIAAWRMGRTLPIIRGPKMLSRSILCLAYVGSQHKCASPRFRSAGTDERGQLFNVEMQLVRVPSLAERLL